jgi:broad specificity phosphatase PhoE
MPASRLYLARHAETTWNLAGRYQGRRESGLSGLGMAQGFALAGAIAAIEPRIERIISSPLLRCTATATFVAERLNIAVETDDRLLEIAHGTWEGRLREEIVANDGARFFAWKNQPTSVAFENGETLAQVDARWLAFARAFAPRVPTLIVTHDVVARLAIVHAQHRSLDDIWTVQVENAAFAIYQKNVAGLFLIEECENSHLAGLHANVKTQAL